MGNDVIPVVLPFLEADLVVHVAEAAPLEVAASSEVRCRLGARLWRS